MSIRRSVWRGTLNYPRAVAIRALGFVSSNRSVMERFLLRAGLSLADLQCSPIRSEHLAALLDFLIKDENTLLEFSRTADLPLEAAYEARRLLSQGGGEQPLFSSGRRGDSRHAGLA